MISILIIWRSNRINNRYTFNSPQSAITTGERGLSWLLQRVLSIMRTTFIPSTTSPNTTCFPFKWGVGTYSIRKSVGGIAFNYKLHTYGGDEKLRTIRVSSSIGHRKQTGSGMLVVEVLVTELFSVNRLTSSSISTSKITTLDHKTLNNTVESASLVMKRLSTASLSLLSSAKSAKNQQVLEIKPEVLWCLRSILKIIYYSKIIHDKASSQYGQLHVKIAWNSIPSFPPIVISKKTLVSLILKSWMILDSNAWVHMKI